MIACGISDYKQNFMLVVCLHVHLSIVFCGIHILSGVLYDVCFIMCIVSILSELI